jgi:hypothetical protein
MLATWSQQRLETTYPVVCKLHAWNHEDATVASLPVIVANERTLAGGAFALGDAGHSEANTFRLVKGSRDPGRRCRSSRTGPGREVLLKAHG